MADRRDNNHEKLKYMPESDIYRAADDRYRQSDKIYRRCGDSGVLLPRISLGMWKGFGAERPYSDSRRMLRAAFDCGVTHFDLANNYGPPYGSAEETMGRAMKEDFAPYRDELFISTKAGYDMWPGPYGNWGSRKYLLASLDQSLKRMNLDYVDLFYSHRYDPETPVDETLQALADAVHQGKALYVGISRWPADKLRYAYSFLKEQHVRLLTYQGRLNMLDRTHEEDGVLSAVEALRCGFMAFSPLAQGLLSSRYLGGDIPEGSRMSLATTLKPGQLTPELLARLRLWNRKAEMLGLSLAQYALLWVLRHSAVTSVIIGVSTVAQLEENLRLIAGTDELADCNPDDFPI